MNEYDREEEHLAEQLNCGEISMEEYNKQMRELQRDYRAAAEDSAREAYDNEMGGW